jgi:hypothetical protein
MAELNTLTIGNTDAELSTTALASDANLENYYRIVPLPPIALAILKP